MAKPELKIRPYRPEDYEAVRSIFDRGIKESFIPALKRNWNGDRPKTTFLHLSFVFSSLLVAAFYSAFIGLTLAVTYLAAHILYLHHFYYSYARFHLNTDLLDREMKFWTTPPHFMLVATVDNNEVAGMVSIQKTKSETTSELNRLSVTASNRGLGIGRALVLAAIKKSQELGFKNVYLETSDVQSGASRLYESIGFKLVGLYVADVGVPFYAPYIYHGIYIRKYLYESK